MIGLKKGIMRYSGFGANEVWTLTHKTKRARREFDVWKIFVYILSRMYSWRDDLRVRLYYGQGHILLRSRVNYGAEGILVDRGDIEKMLMGEEFSDPYVKNIQLFFNAFAQQSHGHHVRLFANLAEFTLIRTDIHEIWKRKGEEKLKGLYVNRSGFCRLDYVRQRQHCRVGKKDQCIFIHAQNEPNAQGKNVPRYYCGKYAQNFSLNRDLLWKKGGICGRRGSCDCLRGIEV